MVVLIVFWGLCLSCGKKVITSEATPYTPSQEVPRAVEAKPAETPEVRVETISPEKPADTGKKAEIQEQTVREEGLREKALREEAARKEAAVRERESKTAKMESIYFDFDQWIIREDQKETIIKDAAWLKANPQVKIRIEGNCDERGTSEYNLALGQKRADSTKSFLEGMGIPANRMQTISYGEERPLDKGQNEAAWGKNRRVDFVPVR
jgi:peptidoglycan-associated lipoprotein